MDLKLQQIDEGLLGRMGNVYFIYKFIKNLVLPFEKTKAYKLNIIDKNGKILKKKKDLETSEEKSAYTLSDRMMWNLKKLLSKIPVIGKSAWTSYAAAALLILKENKELLKMDVGHNLILEDFDEMVMGDFSQIILENTHDLKENDFQELCNQFLTRSEQGQMNVNCKRILETILDESETINEVTMGAPTGSDSGNIQYTDPKINLNIARDPYKQLLNNVPVFVVTPEFYHKCRLGKHKSHKYEKYVGCDETGMKIREFARANPKAPVIVQNSVTLGICYLRYGRK